MFYRCIQKKGLRHKSVKKTYKKGIEKYRKSVLSKIKVFIVFLLSTAWNWFNFLICILWGIIYYIPLWIYELFRFCPFKNKKSLTSEFLVIGHRGAAAYEIENTVPACDAAIEKYGANALEIDLSITKDNEIVLWHDWDPDGIVAIIRQMGLEPNVKYRPFVPMSGMWRKPVNKLMLSELREHYGYSLKKRPAVKLDATIPTFREFMEWGVKNDNLKVVILDIKIPEEGLELVPMFTHFLFQIIESYNPMFNCILLSPYEHIINAMKNYFDEKNYSYDMELPLGIVIDPPEYSSVNKAIELKNSLASIGRPTALQLGPWTTYRRVVQYDIERKREFNQTSPSKPIEKLIGWTINKKREMKCLLKMGIDGILTDKPSVLKKIVDKFITYNKNKGTE